MSKFTVSALLGFACVMGSAGIAAADKCKNVEIHVHNDFEDDGDAIQIQVVDVDYWDDTEGKWREETLSDRIVNPSDDTTYVKSLEYVGGESDVVIRIHFKYMTANNGWSERLTAESTAFRCNDEDHVDIHAR